MIADDTRLTDLKISEGLIAFLQEAVEMRYHARDCNQRVSRWACCDCNWRTVYRGWQPPETFGEVKDVTVNELKRFEGVGVGPAKIKQWEELLAAAQNPDFEKERQRKILQHEIDVHERSIKGFEKAIITQHAKIELLKKKMEKLA